MTTQVQATVLANEESGAYRHLTLAAPGVGEQARPGQFVALAVGGSPTAMLLRRAFSLFGASGSAASGSAASGSAASGSAASGSAASGFGASRSNASGSGDATVELVVAAHGPGSTWVTRRRPGDLVDVAGPLGRPFPQPGVAPGQPGSACVLVGGGYGAAPLIWWARELAGAGREVHAVLGASTADRLFGVEQARAAGATVHLTTDDGSAGTPGRVTAVLPDVLAATGALDVYACGPMAMLRAVAAQAPVAGRAWCAVEESMACGIGVCMTCVLPVRGADGVTRMTRSCVEGPTFAGDAVRWDAIVIGPHGTQSLVPADCLGAPRPTGSTGGH